MHFFNMVFKYISIYLSIMYHKSWIPQLVEAHNDNKWRTSIYLELCGKMVAYGK